MTNPALIAERLGLYPFYDGSSLIVLGDGEHTLSDLIAVATEAGFNVSFDSPVLLEVSHDGATLGVHFSVGAAAIAAAVVADELMLTGALAEQGAATADRALRLAVDGYQAPAEEAEFVATAARLLLDRVSAGDAQAAPLFELVQALHAEPPVLELARRLARQ